VSALTVTEYVMPEADAERLTLRISLTAGTLREGLEKLHSLVAEAKAGNAHVALGYASWTAYLAATLGKEPMQMGRAERVELVGYLAGEGMSTRAIAPIVGAHHDTVATDLKALRSAPVGNPTPAPIASPVNLATVDLTTGEIREPVTGLDGKTYSRPASPKYGTRRKNLTVLDSLINGLGGLVIAADEIRELDDTVTNEEATRLTGDLAIAIKSLNRINNLLKERTK